MHSLLWTIYTHVPTITSIFCHFLQILLSLATEQSHFCIINLSLVHTNTNTNRDFIIIISEAKLENAILQILYNYYKY